MTVGLRPLIKPDGRISRIQLSQPPHRKAFGRSWDQMPSRSVHAHSQNPCVTRFVTLYMAKEFLNSRCVLRPKDQLYKFVCLLRLLRFLMSNMYPPVSHLRAQIVWLPMRPHSSRSD